MYCRLCLRVFSEIEAPSPAPGICPECGAVELLADPGTAEERLTAHLRQFGGDVVLLESLARAGAVVHAFSHGQPPPGFEAFHTCFAPEELSIRIGARHTGMLVTPPRDEPWIWRIRVPVLVTGTGENAAPNILKTVHDTEIAPALLAEGFAPEVLPSPASEGRYFAVWSRTVRNPESAAAFLHAVARLETMVDADAFLWERSFGDLGSLTAFAHRLPAGVYVTQLTPWGISLAAPDRRDLGVIDGEGRGRIYVYLVLPHGFGARAARRRAESALAWFDANVAASWLEQGFEAARCEGPAPWDAGHGRRWSVRLVMRFSVGDDAATRIAWAAAHGVIEFE